jgi:hypothetical protein
MFIEVHPVAQEAVSAYLFDLGCCGVVLGEKGNSFLKAYFPMTERFEELRSRTEVFLRRLREIFPEATQSSLHFSILAIDTDPEALRWARRNIELNHCSESIDLSLKPLSELSGVFSILVANLNRDVLLKLLPDFQRLLGKDGMMILSGLLKEQVKEEKQPLRLLGFKEIQVVTQAEWACITARKTGLLE